MTELKMSEDQIAAAAAGDAAQFVGDTKAITDDTRFCAPGRPSKFAFGVSYCGPHETVEDGTNVAVRRHAKALAASGIPVVLTSPHGIVVVDGLARPIYDAGIPAGVEHEVGGLRRGEIGVAAVRIIHAVVRDASQLQALLLPRSLAYADAELVENVLKRTVLYTVWERDRISEDVAQLMSACGECWVPCEQNAEMLRRSGVPHVAVVPHPFDPEDQLEKMRRRRPSPGNRLYSIGAWQPRKGYDELVGAFLRAFGPDEDVVLTIKTHSRWPGYPSAQESIARHIEHPDVRARGWHPDLVRHHLKIIDHRLTDDGIRRLHFENHVYVAPSHGEAWCVPAYDARQAGNRVVHVPYGGTADFCGHEDIDIPYAMGPVDPSYGWEEDARWAVYEMGDLVAALRQSVTPVDHSRGLDSSFSHHEVGELMRERILGLLVDDDEVRDYLAERREIQIQGFTPEELNPPAPEPEARPEPVRAGGRLSRVRDAIKRLWR